ncbi:MAG: ribosome maturation factor RimP [Candidatus Nanopelagicales bacterium]
MDDLTARVREAVSGPVATAGAHVEAVEVRTAGRRRLVRVSVDTDTGISLDEVAVVTRAVSQALDDTDVMGDRPYVLEVGSPGVAAPLTQERHWVRNVGRLVRITPVDGEPFEARIVAVAGPAITLDVAGQSRVVSLPDVRKAVVQVELNRPQGGRDGH